MVGSPKSFAYRSLRIDSNAKNPIVAAMSASTDVDFTMALRNPMHGVPPFNRQLRKIIEWTDARNYCSNCIVRFVGLTLVDFNQQLCTVTGHPKMMVKKTDGAQFRPPFYGV